MAHLARALQAEKANKPLGGLSGVRRLGGVKRDFSLVQYPHVVQHGLAVQDGHHLQGLSDGAGRHQQHAVGSADPGAGGEACHHVVKQDFGWLHHLQSSAHSGGWERPHRHRVAIAVSDDLCGGAGLRHAAQGQGDQQSKCAQGAKAAVHGVYPEAVKDAANFTGRRHIRKTRRACALRVDG